MLLLALCTCHRPSWESTLAVPIISRRFSISDLGFIPYVGQLEPGPNGVLQFNIRYHTDTLRASDVVTVFSGRSELRFALPDFVLSPIGMARVSLATSSLTGIGVTDSLLVVVPPFVAETSLIARIDGLDSILAAEAVMHVTIDNRSDLRLDSVFVRLPHTGGTVFAAELQPRASMSQRTVVGQTVLRDPLTAVIAVNCRGSDGESLWLRASDSLVVSLLLDSLRVLGGRLELGQTTGAGTARADSLFLNGRHRVRVDSAVISSGSVGVQLTNRLPFGVRCSLFLVEVGRGQILELGPGDSLSWVADLAGLTYSNSNPDSSQLTLECRIAGQLPDGVVELAPDDAVNIVTQVESLSACYLCALVLDTIWGPVVAETLSWQLPDSLRALPIRLSSVMLTGEMYSAFNVGGVCDLWFEAREPGGSVAGDSVRCVVPPGTPQAPSSGRFEIDVSRLVNIIPDRLCVSGRFGLAGPAEVWSGSFVTGQGSATVPMRVKLLPFVYRLGPWLVPLDSALRKFTNAYVRGAEIRADLSNHLPLSLRAELLLWSSELDTVRVATAIPQPSIDPINGWVIAPADTSVVVGLDSTGVATLGREPCFARLVLFFPETDTIALRSEDYFQIDSAVLRLRLDFK